MQHLKPALFRPGDPNLVTSLAGGIEVLSSLQNSATGLRAPTISKRTGFSLAVVSRCLYTLSELGYVRQAEDGYCLEPKILSLSQTYFKANPLLSIRLPRNISIGSRSRPESPARSRFSMAAMSSTSPAPPLGEL